MKKFIYWVVFVLAVYGVYKMATVTPSANAMNAVSAYATASGQAPRALIAAPTGTATLEPTPTVGLTATIAALKVQLDDTQKQLDAANRLMVDATMQSNSMTATMDGMKFEQVTWTQTAALTAVPATQTQSAINQKVVALNLSIAQTAQVMTQTAPTQIVLISEAQAKAQNAGMNEVVRIWSPLFVFFMIVLAVTVVIVVLIVRPKLQVKTQAVKTIPDQSTVNQADAHFGKTVVMTVVNQDRTKADRIVWPCTNDELTFFAQCLLSGKSLGINQWEKKGDLGRNKIGEIRSFLQDKNRNGGLVLVYRKPAQAGRKEGELLPMPELLNILNGWLANGELPHGHEVLPKTEQNSMILNHNYENHGHENGGGGVFVPISEGGLTNG